MTVSPMARLFIRKVLDTRGFHYLINTSIIVSVAVMLLPTQVWPLSVAVYFGETLVACRLVHCRFTVALLTMPRGRDRRASCLGDTAAVDLGVRGQGDRIRPTTLFLHGEARVRCDPDSDHTPDSLCHRRLPPGAGGELIPTIWFVQTCWLKSVRADTTLACRSQRLPFSTSWPAFSSFACSASPGSCSAADCLQPRSPRSGSRYRRSRISRS